MKFLPLAIALASFSSLYAADPATQLAERGKLIFSDDLGVLSKENWKVAKGKWEIAEGALRGAELAADKHGGVLRHAGDMGDAIIQYEIKLDGTKGSTLSVNGAKGHICRVGLSPQGFVAQKDDSDHAGPDVAVIFGRRATPLKAGEWHTVVAEMVGDTLVATIDGTGAVAGAHEALAQPKTNFGFTVAGETVSVRNVGVWEATPKKDAGEIKAKLISETPKAAAGPVARKGRK